MRSRRWAVLVGLLLAGCDKPIESGSEEIPTGQLGELRPFASCTNCTDTLDTGGCTETCDCTPNACQTATCNTCTGLCTYTAKASSVTCSDGNACTTGDHCNGAGACVGGTATTCNSPPNGCYNAAGTCNPSTGACSYTVATGTACNDGNACTTGDVCNSSAVCGGAAVVCNSPPGDAQCYTGACSGGACSYSVKAGAGCNDGNPCTVNDMCGSNGVCAGTAVVCNTPPNTQCYNAAGTCSGGTCQYTVKSGTCDDGNACTYGDACDASGNCKGTAITCTTDQCADRACNGTATCTVTYHDDVVCNTDKCHPSFCKQGTCTPGAPVSCVAQDCQTDLHCDPSTGNCTSTPVTGGACGGNGCSTAGTCNAGNCSGTPKDCSAMNGPCTVGVCDSADGACKPQNKPNGTACDDKATCIIGGSCSGGVCVGSNSKTCSSSDPCKVSSCDTSTGNCVETNAAAGTACTTTNSCLQNAACDGKGACSGTAVPDGTPCSELSCPDSEPTCVAGVCGCAAPDLSVPSGGGADLGTPPKGGDKHGCSVSPGASSPGGSLAGLGLLAVAGLWLLSRRRAATRSA